MSMRIHLTGNLMSWFFAAWCVASMVFNLGCTNGPRPAGTKSENAGTPATEMLGTNPDYESQPERGPKRPLGRELDPLLRPIFVKVFDGAKLLLDGGQAPFTMKYIVARRFGQSHGDRVYQALLATGFEAKEDSKPTFMRARQTVEMTVRCELEGKPYNVSVILDLKNQIVYINAWP